MFKKDSKESNVNPDTTDTIIGESSRIEGNIITKASLRIEGQVEGDIETEGDVTIGKQGEALSNIIARNVLNAGTIRGSVQTKGELTITETGKLYGDILVTALTIAGGGQFQGTSAMKETDEAAAKLEASGKGPVQEAGAEEHSNRSISHLHKVEGKNADEPGKKAGNELSKKAAAK